MKDKKTTLITGASGGIGYELAKIFAREGFNLVLVARREQKLAALAAELKTQYAASVKVIAKDLAIPTSPVAIFEELQREKIPIHILVNNAGCGVHGHFRETDLFTELEMIQLNITSLTHLTKLFLRQLPSGERGRILNVASTAAFQPGPLMAIYYATKAYVLFFSEAIANELKNSGVTVTALCPGPTASDFQERAKIRGVRLLKISMMDSKTVAEVGYRGLMKGKTVVIPSFRNKLLAQSVRLGPRNLVTRIVRFVQERS